MQTFLLLFLGGGIGAVSRHGLSLLLTRLGLAAPWPLLGVNLLGCLLIGFFASLLSSPTPLRLLLITGILGGFTTYSSYTLDLIQLIERHEFTTFFFYFLAHFLGGLCCAVLGVFVGQSLIH